MKKYYNQKIYKEGDIFIINGNEYSLKIINEYGGCWLEQILYKFEGYMITGGKNYNCMYSDLNKLKMGS
jgi:hypothetical protein